MVKITEENGTLQCVFTGRLDSVNCAKWDEHLLAKVEEKIGPVVFDMKEVDYIASGFLRICLQVAKKIGNDNLSVIHVHPYVKKVLKLSGFDRQFKIK